MTTNPFLSVVISVYNNAEDLPCALESILWQTYQNFEIIAIDDGSTDGSGDILDHYANKDQRITVMHQLNMGLGPTLHKGCQRAKGDYLVRQDADDISLPTRFERQVAYLQKNPDVVVCGTWAWIVHPKYGPEEVIEVPDDSHILVNLLEKGQNPFIHGSVMIRRDTYLAEGNGYRLRITSQDLDLWLRLSQYGRLGVIKSVEYLYFLSKEGIGFGNIIKREKIRALIKILHKERLSFGKEVTNWEQEEEKIRYVNLGNMEENVHWRDTVDTYLRGLRLLKGGHWAGYHIAMQHAAQGAGPFAIKARKHMFFIWATPFVKIAYDYRYSKGIGRYIKPLQIGTDIPDNVQKLKKKTFIYDNF